MAAPATEQETTKQPKKAPKMTPKKWAEAEALWESGEVTLADLVARFGKSRSAFQRHFSMKGVKRGSKSEEHKKAVAAATTDAATTEAAVLAARIRETKEEHYKMSTGIAKLVWNEVLQAKAAGSPMSIIQANVKALESAMKVLSNARAERFAVLGLDRADYVDEEGIPELVITELTAEQILELQNRSLSDYGDKPLDEIGEVVEVEE